MGLFDSVSLQRPAKARAGKRSFSVQGALEWAFRREFAQLAPPGEIRPEGDRPGISTIWVMIQRGNLGCKIEGGGTSEPHPDADIVAAIVSALPDALGGFRMATEVAELARTGMTPDWMPNAITRCQPVGRTFNQHGWQGSTEDSARLGSLGWPPVGRRNRKGVIVADPVKFCPVIYSPTAQQIAGARRRYLDWYGAILEIGHQLRTCGMLRQIEVTTVMPPITPWRND